MRHSKTIRGTALFTVLTFVLTNNWMAPTARAEILRTESAQVQSLAIENLKLPAQFGEVVESAKGKTDQSVIIIQDAHSIPDAQKNIANLIEYFEKDYGVNRVALEGATGGLDPQIFKSFPDKKLLREVFKTYFEAGELAGGTAAAIFGDKPAEYIGVENWEKYQDGLALYLAAMEKETEISDKLSVIRDQLNQEKEKNYTKELLAVDRVVEKFYGNMSEVTELVKVLGAVQTPQAGSELEAVWKEVQKTNDQRPTTNDKEIEVREIAGKVEKVLASRTEEFKIFNSKKQEWMTGQMTAEAFGLYLKETAEKFNLHIEMSSELLGMVREQQTLKGIEGTKFFRDLESYIQTVKSKLIREKGIEELNRQTEELRLLTKLSKLELSREDWKQVKAGGRSPEARGSLWSSVVSLLSYHMAFYANAEERDQIFFENLTQKQGSTIMVAGGFHAEGLTSRLKEAGVGYALVMPKINKLPEHSAYQAQMQGEVSWKDYFEVEQGRINLYKAFVRATRDRLIAQSKDPKAPQHDLFILKSWRDQIIRDLSDQNQVARASEYTRYLDEILSNGPKTTESDKLMAKVEKFIDGLFGLEKQNQLNAPNVAQLLRSTAMPSREIAGAAFPRSLALPRTGLLERSKLVVMMLLASLKLAVANPGEVQATIAQPVESAGIIATNTVDNVLPMMLPADVYKLTFSDVSHAVKYIDKMLFALNFKRTAPEYRADAAKALRRLARLSPENASKILDAFVAILQAPEGVDAITLTEIVQAFSEIPVPLNRADEILELLKPLLNHPEQAVQHFAAGAVKKIERVKSESKGPITPASDKIRSEARNQPGESVQRSENRGKVSQWTITKNLIIAKYVWPILFPLLYVFVVPITAGIFLGSFLGATVGSILVMVGMVAAMFSFDKVERTPVRAVRERVFQYDTPKAIPVLIRWLTDIETDITRVDETAGLQLGQLVSDYERVVSRLSALEDKAQSAAETRKRAHPILAPVLDYLAETFKELFFVVPLSLLALTPVTGWITVLVAGDMDDRLNTSKRAEEIVRSFSPQTTIARSESRINGDIKKDFPALDSADLIPDWLTPEMLKDPVTLNFFRAQDASLRVTGDTQDEIFSMYSQKTYSYEAALAQQNALNAALRERGESGRRAVLKVRTAIDAFRRDMKKTAGTLEYEIVELSSDDESIARLKKDFGSGNALHPLGVLSYLSANYKVIALREKDGAILSFISYRKNNDSRYELGLIFSAPEVKGTKASAHLFDSWLLRLKENDPAVTTVETSELSPGDKGGEEFFSGMERSEILGKGVVKLEKRFKYWYKPVVADGDFVSSEDIREREAWEAASAAAGGKTPQENFYVAVIDLQKITKEKLNELISKTAPPARSESRVMNDAEVLAAATLVAERNSEFDRYKTEFMTSFFNKEELAALAAEFGEQNVPRILALLKTERGLDDGALGYRVVLKSASRQARATDVIPAATNNLSGVGNSTTTGGEGAIEDRATMTNRLAEEIGDELWRTRNSMSGPRPDLPDDIRLEARVAAMNQMIKEFGPDSEDIAAGAGFGYEIVDGRIVPKNPNRSEARQTWELNNSASIESVINDSAILRALKQARFEHPETGNLVKLSVDGKPHYFVVISNPDQKQWSGGYHTIVWRYDAARQAFRVVDVNNQFKTQHETTGLPDSFYQPWANENPKDHAERVNSMPQRSSISYSVPQPFSLEFYLPSEVDAQWDLQTWGALTQKLKDNRAKGLLQDEQLRKLLDIAVKRYERMVIATQSVPSGGTTARGHREYLEAVDEAAQNAVQDLARSEEPADKIVYAMVNLLVQRSNGIYFADGGRVDGRISAISGDELALIRNEVIRRLNSSHAGFALFEAPRSFRSESRESAEVIAARKAAFNEKWSKNEAVLKILETIPVEKGLQVAEEVKRLGQDGGIISLETHNEILKPNAQDTDITGWAKEILRTPDNDGVTAFINENRFFSGFGFKIVRALRAYFDGTIPDRFNRVSMEPEMRAKVIGFLDDLEQVLPMIYSTEISNARQLLELGSALPFVFDSLHKALSTELVMAYGAGLDIEKGKREAAEKNKLRVSFQTRLEEMLRSESREIVASIVNGNVVMKVDGVTAGVRENNDLANAEVSFILDMLSEGRAKEAWVTGDFVVVSDVDGNAAAFKFVEGVDFEVMKFDGSVFIPAQGGVELKGASLVTKDRDGLVYAYNLDTQTMIIPNGINAEGGYLFNGSHLAWRDQDGVVRFLNFNTGVTTRISIDARQKLMMNNAFLVALSEKGKIKIINLKTDTPVQDNFGSRVFSDVVLDPQRNILTVTELVAQIPQGFTSEEFFYNFKDGQFTPVPKDGVTLRGDSPFLPRLPAVRSESRKGNAPSPVAERLSLSGIDAQVRAFKKQYADESARPSLGYFTIKVEFGGGVGTGIVLTYGEVVRELDRGFLSFKDGRLDVAPGSEGRTQLYFKGFLDGYRGKHAELARLNPDRYGFEALTPKQVQKMILAGQLAIVGGKIQKLSADRHFESMLGEVRRQLDLQARGELEAVPLRPSVPSRNVLVNVVNSRNPQKFLRLKLGLVQAFGAFGYAYQPNAESWILNVSSIPLNVSDNGFLSGFENGYFTGETDFTALHGFRSESRSLDALDVQVENLANEKKLVQGKDKKVRLVNIKFVEQQVVKAGFHDGSLSERTRAFLLQEGSKQADTEWFDFALRGGSAVMADQFKARFAGQAKVSLRDAFDFLLEQLDTLKDGDNSLITEKQKAQLVEEILPVILLSFTGVNRKGTGFPYTFHLFGVTLLAIEGLKKNKTVQSQVNDPQYRSAWVFDQIVAGLHHDTLEDVKNFKVFDLLNYVSRKAMRRIQNLTKDKIHDGLIGLSPEQERILDDRVNEVSYGSLRLGPKSLVVKYQDVIFNFRDAYYAAYKGNFTPEQRAINQKFLAKFSEKILKQGGFLDALVYHPELPSDVPQFIELANDFLSELDVILKDSPDLGAIDPAKFDKDGRLRKLPSVAELKTGYEKLADTARAISEKYPTREAQLAVLDKILKDVEFAREMAAWLDGAYYRAQGKNPPSFITEKDSADDIRMKVAMNLAGFYALESGLGLIAETTGTTVMALLDQVQAGTLPEPQMLLLARFANATWKAGQPFRDLNRIARPTFRPAASLEDDELKKDFDQINQAAVLLGEKLKTYFAAQKTDDAQEQKVPLLETETPVRAEVRAPEVVANDVLNYFIDRQMAGVQAPSAERVGALNAKADALGVEIEAMRGFAKLSQFADLLRGKVLRITDRKSGDPTISEMERFSRIQKRAWEALDVAKESWIQPIVLKGDETLLEMQDLVTALLTNSQGLTGVYVQVPDQNKEFKRQVESAFKLLRGNGRNVQIGAGVLKEMKPDVLEGKVATVISLRDMKNVRLGDFFRGLGVENQNMQGNIARVAIIENMIRAGRIINSKLPDPSQKITGDLLGEIGSILGIPGSFKLNADGTINIMPSVIVSLIQQMRSEQRTAIAA